jgi:hypothetical protein
MTAHENMSKPQFFHGSIKGDFKPGDEVTTAHSRDYGQGKYNYMTKHKAEASNFAYTGETGKVYTVEPTGTHEADPYSTGRRSKSNLRITGEA